MGQVLIMSKLNLKCGCSELKLVIMLPDHEVLQLIFEL